MREGVLEQAAIAEAAPMVRPSGSNSAPNGITRALDRSSRWLSIRFLARSASSGATDRRSSWRVIGKGVRGMSD